MRTQVGAQVAGFYVPHFSAHAADGVLVRHERGVEAILAVRYGDAPNLAVIRQIVEIAVHRGQTDFRHLLARRAEDFLRRAVRAAGTQKRFDQGTLSTHAVLRMRMRINFKYSIAPGSPLVKPCFC